MFLMCIDYGTCLSNYVHSLGCCISFLFAAVTNCHTFHTKSCVFVSIIVAPFDSVLPVSCFQLQGCLWLYCAHSDNPGTSPPSRDPTNFICKFCLPHKLPCSQTVDLMSVWMFLWGNVFRIFLASMIHLIIDLKPRMKKNTSILTIIYYCRWESFLFFFCQDRISLCCPGSCYVD